MKMRRLFGALTAAVVAASAMTVSAFAALGEGFDPSSGHFICLVSNDSNVPVLKDSSLAGQVTTVNLTVKCKSKDFEAIVSGGTEWYGGGIGTNSTSTGWAQNEWSVQDGIKDYTLKATDTRYEYIVTYTKADGTPFFTSSEEYAFFWFQDWSKGDGVTFDVANIELLNADGVDVRTLDAAAPETPDEPTEETETVGEETEEYEETETVGEETETVGEETETAGEETETAGEETETVGEETETAGEETVPADDTTDSDADADKGSPDTGVAGVAAVVGVAALAGAAVLIARKRK